MALETFLPPNARKALRSASSLVRNHLPAYLASGKKKSVLRQVRELSRLTSLYHAIPEQYLRYRMYESDFDGDIAHFVPLSVCDAFQQRVNAVDFVDLCKDKLLFFERMSQHNVPTPPVLCSLSRSGARSVDGQALSPSELLSLLRHGRHDSFVIKPRFGINGASIRLFTLGDDEASDHEKLAQLFQADQSTGEYEEFLIQPRISQHPALAEISANSVNCVRIDTYATPEGICSSGAMLKLGVGGNLVDNWKYGGLIVRIDLDTGRLGRTGWYHPIRWQPPVTEHPESGIKFQGRSMPYWSALIETVHGAASALRPLTYIGWDVAIGREGPIVIEANHQSDLGMFQRGVDGLRNTVIGNEMLTPSSFGKDPESETRAGRSM